MNELATFLEQNYAKLLRYATFQAFGDRELGREMVQELCMRVLEGRVSVDLTKAPLQYLQLSLRHCLRDYLRSTVIKVDVADLSPPLPPTTDPDVLDKWLALLHPMQRRAIEGVLAGVSKRQIAKEHGVSRFAVQDAYKRGIARLRKHLAHLREGRE